MKEIIVILGSTILGVLIVVSLVLGMLKDQSEKMGETANDRYEEIYDSIGR